MGEHAPSVNHIVSSPSSLTVISIGDRTSICPSITYRVRAILPILLPPSGWWAPEYALPTRMAFYTAASERCLSRQPDSAGIMVVHRVLVGYHTGPSLGAICANGAAVQGG